MKNHSFSEDAGSTQWPSIDDELKLKEDCSVLDAEWVNAFHYLNTPDEDRGPETYDGRRGI